LLLNELQAFFWVLAVKVRLSNPVGKSNTVLKI
jgi:hypothetical protein